MRGGQSRRIARRCEVCATSKGGFTERRGRWWLIDLYVVVVSAVVGGREGGEARMVQSKTVVLKD